MLQLRLGQPEVTGLVQTAASDALRMRPLDPGPPGVLRGELGGLLPLPRGLDRHVLLFRPDGQLAGSLFRRCARCVDRTRTTGRPIKSDVHDGITGNIPPRSPLDTGLPPGAAGLLRLPIQDKGLQVIALACHALTAIGPKGRADPIDVMRGLGGTQERGIDITAVEQMRARQEITIGQVLLDGRSHDAIGRGRRCRQHLGDELWVVIITGVGQVNPLADPGDTALSTIPGFWIVR
jgi:hypothetical protein